MKAKTQGAAAELMMMVVMRHLLAHPEKLEALILEGLAEEMKLQAQRAELLGRGVDSLVQALQGKAPEEKKE